MHFRQLYEIPDSSKVQGHQAGCRASRQMHLGASPRPGWGGRKPQMGNAGRQGFIVTLNNTLVMSCDVSDDSYHTDYIYSMQIHVSYQLVFLT